MALSNVTTWYNTATEEGIKKGMRKGIEKGIEKGIKKGRKKGREEEKLEIARKMKKAGRPLSEIEEFTGLPSQAIEQL